jgi:hypothetical protein
MRDCAQLDSAYVVERLDEAGKALMALPGRGIFPTGIRSSMPDYLQVPEDREAYRPNVFYSASEADRPRWTPPSSREISLMDEVYLRWIPLLPVRTDLELRTRRLVQLRSLVWPESEREDAHVWPWRRLGEYFGINDKTVAARHARAVDLLVRRLRALPEPCAITFARIIRSEPQRSRNSAA